MSKNKREKRYTPDFERSKQGNVAEYISFIVAILAAMEVNVSEKAYNKLPTWAKRHWKKYE